MEGVIEIMYPNLLIFIDEETCTSEMKKINTSQQVFNIAGIKTISSRLRPDPLCHANDIQHLSYKKGFLGIFDF